MCTLLLLDSSNAKQRKLYFRDPTLQVPRQTIWSALNKRDSKSSLGDDGDQNDSDPGDVDGGDPCDSDAGGDGFDGDGGDGFGGGDSDAR